LKILTGIVRIYCKPLPGIKGPGPSKMEKQMSFLGGLLIVEALLFEMFSFFLTRFAINQVYQSDVGSCVGSYRNLTESYRIPDNGIDSESIRGECGWIICWTRSFLTV
jgi:hypothetical protein